MINVFLERISDSEMERMTATLEPFAWCQPSLLAGGIMNLQTCINSYAPASPNSK